MKRLFFIVAIACVALPASQSYAQPVEYVKICDTKGPGYYIDPGSNNNTCVDATAGVKAEEGVALSLALPAATVNAGKTFGAGIHYGTFQGQSAIGVGGAFKANDNLTFDGAFGVGLGQGTMGGRAGANVSW